MVRLLAVLMVAGMLGGCVSRVAAKKDDEYCQSIGAKPGTETYTKCRLQLRAEGQSNSAAGVAQSQAWQQNWNNFMQQQRALEAQVPQPNPYGNRFSCTSNRIGTLTTTNCY